MHPSIAAKQAQIAKICRRFHVRRLEVFGSAARGNDFDPARSDADFLVEFENASPISQFSAYFGLENGLRALLGRDVDLVSPSAVDNPFVRASIDRSRELIYGS
jgi:predicted nucleotidyltransferase